MNPCTWACPTGSRITPTVINASLAGMAEILPLRLSEQQITRRTASWRIAPRMRYAVLTHVFRMPALPSVHCLVDTVRACCFSCSKYPLTRVICGCGVCEVGKTSKLLKIKTSGSSSVAERQLPKLNVAGSIPVSRSKFQPLSLC